MTVLHSLNHIQASPKNEVTVLFIGAEVQAEVQPLQKWEKYLLHFLPSVKTLNLIFLGPELRKNNQEFWDDLPCHSCRYSTFNWLLNFS